MKQKDMQAKKGTDAVGEKNGQATLTGIPPVVGDKPKLLILGSMPGAESLRLRQYYAYRQNRFWPVLFRFFGAEPTDDYEARKRLATENGIALWDSIAACRRDGSSLDSRIRDVVPNDIPALLWAHPTIGGILVNGRKSEDCFRRAFPSLRCKCLPSTSPANASFAFDRLYAIWSEALRAGLGL